MADTIRKVLGLLNPRERRRGTLVLAMMLLLALLETAGVASIMPFLAVLGNPEVVETNQILAWLFDRGQFSSRDEFLFALGLGAFGLVMFSAFFRISTTYAMNRFTQMRRCSIGVRLLQAYLRQPYEFFLNRNSADLSKSILSEVDTVVLRVIKPMMDLLAYGMITIVLATFLVVLDPGLAVLVVLMIVSAYAAIYVGVRRTLGRMGGDRVRANRERYTAASEAFGGIKDLKVLGREKAYVERFQGPAARYARYDSLAATMSAVPRYLIEAVGFGGVLALALFLMSTRNDFGEVLPLLGLYAFAGLRLLPAAHYIYAGVSQLRFGLPALDSVYGDLVDQSVGNEAEPSDQFPLSLKTSIQFDHVSFRYPGAESEALQLTDLTIKARTSVAFVGETGAGKTTAADLILGLLQPTVGRLLIDGEPLTSTNLRSWQLAIGYVPQTIYLADASITENIAFGVNADQIDFEAVKKAAQIANIDRFIEDSLPRGYETEVGERGIRLSGGQRQRIGIARALYHDPCLLVLDEATSALDTGTERAIMESVDRLSGEKTIVMIAHRMSTVEKCDEIVVLDGGHVKGIGPYQELKRSNSTFQRIAVA
jgi:ATP-binding cassette, subfamily B, bacterial PglK